MQSSVDARPDLAAVLEEVAAVARPCADEGRVPTYVRELARVDPSRFALAVHPLDGPAYEHGDVDDRFAIQSISKVFALVLAMRKVEEHGGVWDELWSRVGREPSGDPFNSLVQLEHEKGIPRNPMINAGALVVDDVLLKYCDDPLRELVALLSELAGADVLVSEDIARDEEAASGRNRAMANLMLSFGNLGHDVDAVMDLYNHQCAVEMTTGQLARAVRFLANDGVDPATGRQVLSPEHARRVAALMLTCGTYDSAGEFAFSIGLPCKSGVAGAIVALAPDQAGICVWSPPLDGSGNSVAGRVALAELSDRLDLTVFRGPGSEL